MTHIQIQILTFPAMTSSWPRSRPTAGVPELIASHSIQIQKLNSQLENVNKMERRKDKEAVVQQEPFSTRLTERNRIHVFEYISIKIISNIVKKKGMKGSATPIINRTERMSNEGDNVSLICSSKLSRTQ